MTLFPNERLYHSPRDITDVSLSGLSAMRLLTAEPPGVRPPGHWMHDRVAEAEHYRPLAPLLWKFALHGPRRALLADIAGTAAYRLVIGSDGERPHAPGALGSALDRLQRGSAPLREIAQWPGMSVERASRLLNGLYLVGCLLITRTHPGAREPKTERGGWFGLGRPRR